MQCWVGRLLLAVWALSATGCLEPPAPAGQARCLDGLDPSTDLGALEGTKLQVRDVVTADVNLDGADDLLVLSQGGTPGIYVLLGPLTRDDLHYQLFLPTEATPMAVTVAPLVGDDDCPDLAVFGHLDGSPDVGQVAIYSAPGGHASFALAARRDMSAPDPDDPSRIYGIATGDFDHDGAGGDIALSDRDTLYLLATAGDPVANLGEGAAPTVCFDTDCAAQFGELKGVRAVPSAGGDDLQTLEDNRTRLVRCEDQNCQVAYQDDPDYDIRTCTSLPLDDTPPDDLLCAGWDRFGMYFLTDDAEAEAPQTIEWTDGLGIYQAHLPLTQFLMGQVEAGPEPDVVALDHEAPDSDDPGSTLFVVADARDDGDFVRADQPVSQDLADPLLDHAALADNDGDGVEEVWLFEDAGAARCLHATGPGALVPCFSPTPAGLWSPAPGATASRPRYLVAPTPSRARAAR